MKAPLCECGCGGTTKLWKKGRYGRFIRGHQLAGNAARRGPAHGSWKGGRHTSVNGYVMVHAPHHPRASRGAYVYEHIAVAEKVLGKILPDGAVVHHVNGDKQDNRPANLVICQDQGYHRILHRRQSALDGSGHADWLRCPYCKDWDAPSSMYVRSNGDGYHRACERQYKRDRLYALRSAEVAL